MKESEKLILLQQCYSVMGSVFMRALSTLEYNPTKIFIVEYDMFIVLRVDKEKKYILWKEKVNIV